MEASDAPTSRPLLVYDDDCKFCQRWVARWRRLTGGAVAYRPYQEVAAQFPEISRAAFAASVHLIEPDGRIWTGADAVFRTMEYSRRKPKFLWLRNLPGFMPLARGAYTIVAGHRSFFSRFT